MKKNNRSQSSFRVCKTLHSEDDTQNSQYIANVSQANHLVKAKPSASMIHRQSDHSDILDRSISERHIHPFESIQESKQDQPQLANYFRDKCIKYEKQIREMNKKKMDMKDEERTNVCTHCKKGYNYSEQYYCHEISQLKKVLQEKDQQISRFRGMYSSKTSEIQGINTIAINKIEREQKDKNLYIKEINQKNIEINKLQDLLAVYKSEQATTQLLLREKDSQIQEFNAKISHVDLKKKKIETYETQLRESHDFLKEIELKTQNLEAQLQNRENIIRQKSRVIEQLQLASMENAEFIKNIETEFLNLNINRKGEKDRFEEVSRDCQKWKEEYYSIFDQMEGYKQLEVQNQNLLQANDDLRKRNHQLVNINEKHKFNQITQEKTILKNQELQKQIISLKNQLNNKTQLLEVIEDQQTRTKEIQLYSNKIKAEKEEVYEKFQEKIKENKFLQNAIDNLNLKLNGLEEESKELIQKNQRLDERNHNIDAVMKENAKLSNSLIEKINEVEKLHQKINNLDSKLVNINSQMSKCKSQLHQKQESIESFQKINSSLDQNLQISIQLTATLEQKVLSLKEDNLQQKNIENQLNKQLDDAKMQQEQQVEKSNSIKMEIIKLHESKAFADELLKQAYQKIAWLSSEVEDCKKIQNEQSKAEIKQRQFLQKVEAQIAQLQHENQVMKGELVENYEISTKIREMADLMTGRTARVINLTQ